MKWAYRASCDLLAWKEAGHHRNPLHGSFSPSAASAIPSVAA